MRWPALLADRLQRPKPGRILVVGTVAAVIVAIAVWFTTAARSDRPAERSPATTIARDPLEAELARCNDLGSPAIDDPGCKRAWSENRRRFLGGANAQAPAVNEHPGAPISRQEQR
ncbi:putative entry exclusion protein TrbK-alt [Phenylobacterium immobile]|uniref:putative entry exclusion protein TrbK-alt n=1 Tax=Phenylobacterium immobile TaxID=21 RepID=UPI000AEA9D53|nr:putative entry exclusion protein TrbK-alt [Phenylobacterium immobile]